MHCSVPVYHFSKLFATEDALSKTCQEIAFLLHLRSSPPGEEREPPNRRSFNRNAGCPLILFESLDR